MKTVKDAVQELPFGMNFAYVFPIVFTLDNT